MTKVETNMLSVLLPQALANAEDLAVLRQHLYLLTRMALSEEVQYIPAEQFNDGSLENLVELLYNAIKELLKKTEK